MSPLLIYNTFVRLTCDCKWSCVLLLPVWSEVSSCVSLDWDDNNCTPVKSIRDASTPISLIASLISY